MTATTALSVPTAAQRAEAAAAFRTLAEAASQRSRESWDRSDTDGFVSQWASDSSANRYQAEADLAERGGLMVWQVPAQPAVFMPNARYGPVWMLVGPQGEAVGWAKPGTKRQQWAWAVVPARIEGAGTLAIHYFEVPVTRRSDEFPTWPTEAEAEAALAALLAG